MNLLVILLIWTAVPTFYFTILNYVIYSSLTQLGRLFTWVVALLLWVLNVSIFPSKFPAGSIFIFWRTFLMYCDPSCSLLNNFRFGKNVHKVSWKLSLAFWVPPRRHFFNSSSLVNSSYNGFNIKRIPCEKHLCVCYVSPLFFVKQHLHHVLVPSGHLKCKCFSSLENDAHMLSSIS